LAFVDVYDALISDWPYKKAFPPEQAVKIISDECGTQFDPELKNIFLFAAGRFR
jgi:HD-GYP domain-containing protein (c-di-GMP phosphodiesterase class II)